MAKMNSFLVIFSIIVSGALADLWVPISPKLNYPTNCHVGGYEVFSSFSGETYIARRRVKGELVVGKTILEWRRGYFPIDGAEEEYGDFEAFCNNLKVQWVPKDDTVKRNWIVAGLAGDGKPLHICRAVYENFIIPGKYYEPHADCCYIGLYKKEVCSKDFTILASLEQ